ncbi:MAG: type I 3-dehydroquinate dehydratase [Methanoregula sp.]|jgi:3-dehydroquinate dehydratase-1|uniref:type I 3-dehydroquinate dehydratase n=1 Tax=Methanoregula sp. TaxID=2052170 RepID=UPI003C173ECE
MKIVAALTDPTHAALAEQQGADLIELRVDLYEGDLVQLAKSARAACSLPIIITLRSAPEGGHFFGTADEWITRVEPLIPFADYIDIEQNFDQHAYLIRNAKKKIIASHHTGQMIPLYILFVMERELREYGDIPKIVVTPQNEEDIIELLAFTHAVNKPVITGVMGRAFRYARAMLPLFGSEFVYCHTGEPTAEGQYSVEEFVQLKKLLLG